MRRLFPLLLLLAATQPAAAQPAADCSAAEAYLDAGNVRARLLNNGSFFYNAGAYDYEVPKGSGQHAAFSTSFWIGGFVRDTLRISAETYGPYLFRPGPLGADGRPPADCAPYNRLYELRRDDLVRLHSTGERTSNVQAWPDSLGAPVLPGGVPALYGDQTLWWVMNDVAAPRVDSFANNLWRYDAPPVGVEVRVAAFAYDVPGDLANTTFYRLQVTYRGDAPLDSAYVGFYADDDIGDFSDDHAGSDTTLHLAYSYNADDDDDTYGAAPPALGYTLLRTPAGDDGRPLGMTTFVPIFKGAHPYGEPSEPEHFYNNLAGRWRRGQPMYVGGFGTPDDPDADRARPTLFGFPGDPTTRSFWSMLNTDGDGGQHWASDKRFSFSTGPFTMQPGETEELWLAVVWSRGTDHLDSVRRLKEDVAYLHTVADGLFTPANVSTAYQAPAVAPPLEFTRPYPNPAAERARVAYTLPHAMPARLALYDALGREVRVVAEGEQAAGAHAAEVDVRGLAPGTYFLRLALYGTAFTRPLVVVR